MLLASTRGAALVIVHVGYAIPQPVRKVAAPPLRKHGSRFMTSLRRRPSVAGSLATLFDETFYTTRYPDVNPRKIDPFLHYLVYGEREGRAPRRELDYRFPGIGFIDLSGSLQPSSRPSLMFVLHEATVTGAPMLGLELVRQLSWTFDIYLVFLRGGTLLREFLRYCVTAAVPNDIDSASLLSESTRKAVALPREFDYVIANTVVAGQALSTFDRKRAKGIVTLIHEYPAPEWVHMHDLTMRTSDLVVYSSEFVQNATKKALGSEGIRNSRVFPQGKIPYNTVRNTARNKLEVDEDPTAQWTGKRLVVGCGTIDFRKGVDIFISVADLIIREKNTEDLQFIWLGPKGPDAAYDSMVKMQLARSDVRTRFTFIDHLDNPSVLIEKADVFLLTSRMDPLPNVAIDALYGGIPVVCFRDAGGIPDLVTRLSKLSEVPVGHIVRYCDASEMSAKAIGVLRSSVSTHRSSKGGIQDELTMKRYCERLLDTLGQAVERRKYTERLVRYLTNIKFPDAEEYVISWSTGALLRRKPAVGFNPGEIAERAGFDWEPVESYPLHARQLIAKRVDLPMRQTLTRVVSPNCSPSYRVGLHIHVYYDDLLDDIFDRLRANTTRPDIFLSVPSDKTALTAAEIAAAHGFTPLEIKVFPNRGRDIWPLLDLSARISEQYDLLGHVHTKNSLHVRDRDFVRRWRNFLFDNTLGGRFPTLDLIVERMSRDESLAIAFPDDPYTHGWTSNEALGTELLNAMGWCGPVPSYFDFPVGAMFWATPTLFALLRKLDLSFERMPSEPLPIDGTLLHALERVLGIAPSLISGHSLSVRMPGTNR